MLALQPRFQCFHLLLQLALAAGVARALEGPRAVLKKGPLPLVKQAGVDLVLLAQVRYCFALQQMQPENLHLLFATEMAPFILTHNTVPFYGHQCVSSILKPAFSAEAEHNPTYIHANVLLFGFFDSALRCLSLEFELIKCAHMF